MWVTGAAWAAHYFYDYYLYTGDETFLRERALPFMEQAAFFFEDYLYEGPDGKFIFSPTQSPENWPEGSKSQATFNATMDVTSSKELLTNLISASMHNRRSLFNMDISGGQPSVIIKMLVASDPGTIQLLPARPKAWPTGTIEGVLCRGAVEVNRLHWHGDKVEVRLTSTRSQELVLALPSSISEIQTADSETSVAMTHKPNERKIALPAGRAISFTITLKRD